METGKVVGGKLFVGSLVGLVSPFGRTSVWHAEGVNCVVADDDGSMGVLGQCHSCGRSFNVTALEKHQKVSNHNRAHTHTHTHTH
jgi:hypothetical protein